MKAGGGGATPVLRHSSQRERGRSSEKEFDAPRDLGTIPKTRAMFRLPRWPVLVESIRCRLVRERWVEREPWFRGVRV